MVERKEKVKFKKIPKRKEVNNAERIRMNMLNCIRKVTREKVKKLIKRKEVKNYKIRTNIFEIIKKKKGKNQDNTKKKVSKECRKDKNKYI